MSPRLQKLMRMQGLGGAAAPPAPPTPVPLTLSQLPVLWGTAKDLSGADAAVASYADKGTAAKVWAQSTAARQPLWTATSVTNSLPGFVFDGNDNLITDNTPVISPTSPFTLFVVCQMTNRIGFPTIMNFATAVGAQAPNLGSSGAGLQYQEFYFGAGAGNFNKGINSTSPLGIVGNSLILDITFDGTGSATTHFASRVNGASQTVGVSDCGSGTSDNILGGVVPSDNGGLRGVINEWAFYGYQVSAPERTLMHSYLSSEWLIV